METEALNVAVVMQRTLLHNRWQPHQWKPVDILMGDALLPGDAARCLRDDPADTRWLFPGFAIKLYRDEAEGYFLNIDSPVPCWFVMCRMENIDGVEVAVPKRVTLSYNEAARLMDGGEQVETLPAAEVIVQRMAEFIAEHYRPEPKGKRRKPSFEGGAAVEQMAKQEGDAHGR
ncbi:DUF3305 domain-containing protein [Noviherbaspirillum cavernae]|uniref:DUF3305 domain-containing protein n=1 Tax=Noviherbaspirillum cavernae TaxID=2320862 RepID=A0A418X4Q2_9BURK|nr:DUF3305 domain-containing protein [Noviherbaspirillum cavernae]RJG07452.1 DUF3305 domain-containing protein [Noviherbaspirillum cavernae]